MLSEDKTLKTLLQADRDCPDELEIYEYAHSSGKADASPRIEIHLQKCARCAAELSLYRDFESSRPEPREEADVRYITAQLRKHSGEVFGAAPAKRAAATPRNAWAAGWHEFFSSWRLPALSMAAAVLFVAVGVYVTMRTAPEVAIPNLHNLSSEVRSTQIELVSPLGDQATAPTELSWKPVNGAARYEARIMEVDRTELWKSGATATVVQIPKEVYARIVPAKKLLWQVSALDPAGRQIAASGEGEFRLVPAK